MKKVIKKSFSRFAESYNKEAFLQKKAALELSEYAQDLTGLGLDLGCGTGFLYESLSNKNIVGIDISPDMAFFYKRKNEKVVIGDIEQLPFKDSIFDYAVSNFSLHWTDLDRSFGEVHRVLKKEGYFVFNIPFYGSLDVIEKILGYQTFSFLCVPEILKKLKEKDFRIEDFYAKDFSYTFKDGFSLLSHLHKTGVSINEKATSLSEKRRIFFLFKSYRKPIPLKYRLLFVRAYKT